MPSGTEEVPGTDSCWHCLSLTGQPSVWDPREPSRRVSPCHPAAVASVSSLNSWLLPFLTFHHKNSVSLCQSFSLVWVLSSLFPPHSHSSPHRTWPGFCHFFSDFTDLAQLRSVTQCLSLGSSMRKCSWFPLSLYSNSKRRGFTWMGQVFCMIFPVWLLYLNFRPSVSYIILVSEVKMRVPFKWQDQTSNKSTRKVPNELLF